MSAEPSQADVAAYLTEHRNWGRWGDDDQRGTINLITPEKRLAALRTVRSGNALSLSRPLSTATGPANAHPASHYMKRRAIGHHGSTVPRPDDTSGFAADYYGMYYHGTATTHIDALSHVWDDAGLYNGRDPDEHITFDGATWGGIEHWKDGIVTRCVLLDVPRHRGGRFVTAEEPVHGDELEAILAERDVSLEPGDAVAVYSGREAWQRANPSEPYGRVPFEACCGGIYEKPGLHASCLKFLRDHDVSVLVWDMLDHTPFGYDVSWTVHGAIHAFGLALVDNALLEPLSDACAEHGQDDFALFIAPLYVNGGTGSPVNPIALL